MLKLLARRVVAQWQLLAAVLAVVTIGTTLLGICALLVTRTPQRAVEAALSRAGPHDVDVTAYAATVRGPDVRSVAADTRQVLTSALAPFDATTTARASTVVRSLPSGGDVPVETYLSSVEGLPDHARLTAGRWPRSTVDTAHPATPLEAVVLEPTARLLGLAPGSVVHLGPELYGNPGAPLDVTIVGIVNPLPGTGWDRDPLAASGYDLAYRDGRSMQPVHAYGPFLVDFADLLAGGCTIDRFEVTAHPDLSAPSARDLDAVSRAVLGADRRLAPALDGSVDNENVVSRLPSTVRNAREQQQVAAATVLTIAALVGVLGAAALALAVRLTASVRTGETALLSALGVSRTQFAVSTAVEAGVIAALAAVCAVPASSALYAGLTRLPLMARAGLAVRPGLTGTQVLFVAGGAIALAALLAVLALRPAPVVHDRWHPGTLARSGADLLLVAFAAAGWWQLRAQPSDPSYRGDTVRVLAPVLLLVAGATVVLRLVPSALRGADRLARRGRGLVIPLAAFEAARRPRAVAAGLLICLACAAATFGVAFHATWLRSQRDQADLAVGTDLALSLATPPVAGQGAVVGTATGGIVSPAVDRGIAVGQWLGGVGDPPRLVAIDTGRAGALLRGRIDDGRAWAQVGAALTPPDRVTGLAVPMEAPLSLTGTATGATVLAVTPRLVLQDATGLRTSCTGEPVPLDGRAHPLEQCATATGLRLVAVSLAFSVDPAGTGNSRVAVALTVPAADADGDGAASASPWTATSAEPAAEALADPAVTVSNAGGSTRLGMTTTVQLDAAPDAARNLIATAFPAPGPVPIAVSTRFADAAGVHRGSRLSLTVGTTPVPVSVADVVPTVPSAVGAAAVLADLDTLSRALILSGALELPTDAYWVGGPSAGATARATALRVGTVTTRAGEAARRSGDPLHAALPAALWLLVAAAAVLLIAGVVLHVSCDMQLRAVEVARLRGLGMSRRQIRTTLLLQHAGIMVPMLAAGAAVGALATRLAGPLLVRSDTGAAPAPVPLASWPWLSEAALLAVLLAACTLAVAAVVTVEARRADAAHLRVAS